MDFFANAAPELDEYYIQLFQHTGTCCVFLSKTFCSAHYNVRVVPHKLCHQKVTLSLTLVDKIISSLQNGSLLTTKIVVIRKQTINSG